MSAGKSALLLGATGATGKHLLQELLKSSIFTRVGEYGRRVTPADHIATGMEKLEQKKIDFEKLEEAGLKEGKWDVVFITLGTTRAAAGSAAAFEKIDRDYVVNAARYAKQDDPAQPQKIVYLSATSANPNSYMLYTRSKGLTEHQLAGLGYSDTIIFRPGLLMEADRSERGESRLLESLSSKLMSLSSPLAKKLSIPTPILAKAMRRAGELGSSSLPTNVVSEKDGDTKSPFTVLGNAASYVLAEDA